jgi:hypothetical protein
MIEPDGSVMFIFDENLCGISDCGSVVVTGSFTGWNRGVYEAWVMTHVSSGLWMLPVPAAKVSIPGNSGFPEFKFIASCGGCMHESPALPDTVGYQMLGNRLVIFPGDDISEAVRGDTVSRRIKTLADFNLGDTADRAVISNIRIVPGTSKLWRGYHPYKKSRPGYDTEDARIAVVKQALEEKNIRSIITLCGNEPADPLLGESISLYQQNIIAQGNELFTDTSYEAAYYHSAEQEFGNVISTVVRFINSHPGPYYVHCRLGSDRTGNVSAVLAAFCGASWDDIAADYEKTGDCGIGEFRSRRLLAYSFRNMLGMSPENAGSLQKKLAGHFIQSGYLGRTEIETAADRLR